MLSNFRAKITEVLSGFMEAGTMTPINKNWTDADGNHAGGQSIGEKFTIAWQRGPLKESGRNGAFLIEVLEACQEWIATPYQAQSRWAGSFAYGIGFTIVFGMDSEMKAHTLKQVFKSCIHQICYYQDQSRFKCEENDRAIGHLTDACEALPDFQESQVHLLSSITALVQRRDRRDIQGTLGTHIGETVSDAE